MNLNEALKILHEAGLTTDRMTAYHISRHKFDKFKLSEDNDGMGTSFYGFGLYFTLDKDIIEYYKDQMGEPYVVYQVELDSSKFINEYDEEYGLDFYGNMVEELGSEVKATKLMLKKGITGMTYHSPEDGSSVIVYNPKVILDMKIIEEA